MHNRMLRAARFSSCLDLDATSRMAPCKKHNEQGNCPFPHDRDAWNEIRGKNDEFECRTEVSLSMESPNSHRSDGSAAPCTNPAYGVQDAWVQGMRL
jgi:hypothetical protein